jgi:hypothetical protein
MNLSLCIFVSFFCLIPHLFSKIKFERLLLIDDKIYSEEQAKKLIIFRKNPEYRNRWNLGYATGWLYSQPWSRTSSLRDNLKSILSQNSDYELKKLDLNWANVPKQFEALNKSVAKEEEAWIRTLPSFNSVSKRAKEAAKKNDKLVVLKSLHVWQSLEDAVVAVRKINPKGDIILTTVYPSSEYPQYSFRKPVKIIAFGEESRVEKLTIIDVPSDKLESYGSILMKVRNSKLSPIFNSDIENSIDVIRWSIEGLNEVISPNKEIKSEAWRSLLTQKYGIKFEKNRNRTYIASLSNSFFKIGDSYFSTWKSSKSLKKKSELKTETNILDAFD